MGVRSEVSQVQSANSVSFFLRLRREYSISTVEAMQMKYNIELV
jgi:hypothetical protein